LHSFGGGFLWFRRESGVDVTEVSRFSAAEAESFFLASFAFFGGEFGDFYGVYVHSVGVMRFRGGWGERLVGVGRFDVSPSDFVGAVPLGLEMDGLLIPVADGGRDGVHRHDASHEGGGNPGRVISDKNIFVVDGGHGYVVLKEGGVFCEGWGVFISSSILSGFLDHSLGGEPGDGVGFNIMVFECCFKICNEDGEGSHCNSGSYEGVVPEHGCPG